MFWKNFQSTEFILSLLVQVKKIYFKSGHIAILLSPESINTIILLDNSLNIQDSKEFEIINFFEKLNSQNVGVKEKFQVEKNEKNLIYKDLKNTFFKLVDVTTNTMNQMKLNSTTNTTTEPTLQKKKEEELSNTLRFVSKEPILCFGDEINIYIDMWFVEEKETLKFYVLQNNGNLWSWSWDEKKEFWKSLGNVKISKSNQSTIHYSCYVKNMNALVWFEKSTIRKEEVKKVGNIFMKKLSENSQCISICDLFEIPRIKREIGFDIFDLKESKNGFWIFTSEKILFVNLLNFENFKTNYFPTAILEYKNIKFKTEETNFYISYCFHPISKELILFNSDGTLKIAKISSFNKTLIECEDFFNFKEFDRSSKNSILGSFSLKDKEYEIFFSSNFLFCIFDYQHCYFYEPRTKKLIFKITLTPDMIVEKENFSKFKTWQTNADMRMVREISFDFSPRDYILLNPFMK
jgi:hypothetical protein